jgi:hypothetical protein
MRDKGHPRRKQRYVAIKPADLRRLRNWLVTHGEEISRLQAIIERAQGEVCQSSKESVYEG